MAAVADTTTMERFGARRFIDLAIIAEAKDGQGRTR
jgi:hypothetical protein